MDYDVPLAFEPTTPDYVMEVMRSLYGEAAYPPDSDPYSAMARQLEPTTTVDAWIWEWDLELAFFSYRPLADFLNQWWNVKISHAAWRRLINNCEKHTLQDVCELIARYAVRPVVRPVTVLGRDCGPASAFLALRSVLKQLGAKTEKLAPSTPIASYTRQFPVTLERLLRKLAPGGIPRPFVVEARRERAIRRTIFAGIALLPISVIPLLVYRDWNPASGFMIALGLVLSLGVGAVAAMLPEPRPDSVTFGELRTFRDLAERIAATHAGWTA